MTAAGVERSTVNEFGPAEAPCLRFLFNDKEGVFAVVQQAVCKAEPGRPGSENEVFDHGQFRPISHRIYAMSFFPVAKALKCVCPASRQDSCVGNSMRGILSR